MNLHAIVSPLISAVNPPVAGRLRISLGNTTLPSGRQEPAWDDVGEVRLQMQPVSTRELELELTAGMNIQGVLQGFWLSGNVEGVNRLNQKGGDLIDAGEHGIYKVTTVLEHWATSGWCHVIATLQTDR